MLIALDIDNTLYDTDRCEEDIITRAHELYNPNQETSLSSASFELVFDYIEKQRQDIKIFFNPQYLIADAIDALKRFQEEHEDVHYCIITARQADLSYYDLLFKDCGLKFDRIVQRYDFMDKSYACYELRVDILVDDSARNYLDHDTAGVRWDDYKTSFILYTGHSKEQDPYLEYVKEPIEYEMKSWAEFSSIAEALDILNQARSKD